MGWVSLEPFSAVVVAPAMVPILTIVFFCFAVIALDNILVYLSNKRIAQSRVEYGTV